MRNVGIITHVAEIIQLDLQHILRRDLQRQPVACFVVIKHAIENQLRREVVDGFKKTHAITAVGGHNLVADFRQQALVMRVARIFAAIQQLQHRRRVGKLPPQAPKNRDLQKIITLLNRSRLRIRHDDVNVAGVEQIDLIQRHAGADIHHHKIRLQLAQMANHFQLFPMLELRKPDDTRRAANQPQAFNGRRDGQLFQRLGLPLHKIAQRLRRHVHAEHRVQVRAAKIGIDQRHAQP